MADQGQPRRAVSPAIITVDTYGRMIRVDDAAVALLGAPEQDLAATDATIVLRLPDGTPVPPDEHPAMVAIRTGQPVPPAVYALERLYQRWAWVRVSAVPAPSGADVELIDLSDDEALVAALERARRLESVLHQIDDYVYVWEYLPDGTSRPIAESIPSRKFFGIEDTPGGLADEDLWRLRVHPDDRHLYDAVTTAQAEGRGGTGEYRLVHEDGTIVHVFDRWHGFVRRDGVAVVQGVISDVTTMRVAEAAERASEERFRVLAEAAPVGIYIADAEGMVAYANDRWHEIYALDGQDARRRRLDRGAASRRSRRGARGLARRGRQRHDVSRHVPAVAARARGTVDREPRLPAARRGRRHHRVRRHRRRRHGARPRDAGARAAVADRRADRAREPAPDQRADRGGGGPGARDRRHARRADARRRPLQGGQRRLRAPGRRRGARGDCDPHRGRARVG